jgi:hypothetical protein
MAEAKGLLIEQAEELSSRLFNTCVESALHGRDEGIVIEWVEDGVDFEGEPAQKPIVTLSGEPAPQFVRRYMEWSASSTDELIVATGELFQEKMGTMWEATVDMYEELDVAISALAKSKDAGYLERARSLDGGTIMRTDNIDGSVYEDTQIARQLVLEDLRILSLGNSSK